MNSSISQIMTAALVVASSGAALSAQTYTIVDLGEPEMRTWATDVNNAGSVVGEWSGTENVFGSRPALWEGTNVTILGSPPVELGAAAGINEMGQVVIVVLKFSGDSEPNVHPQSYLWHDGVMVPIHALPGDEFCFANDVNDRGHVVGYSFPTANDNHAFIWNNQNGTRPLGSLGGEYSLAKAINNNGEVVGTADTGTNRHAFLWTADEGMRDLGTFGGTYSSAIGINDQGQVVGLAKDEEGKFRAFVWDRENGLQDISAPYMQFSFATDVNELGDIVGVFRYTPGGRRYACLWRKGAPIVLEDHLAPDSGWQLNQAHAINDVGQIVGVGSRTNNWDAFLLNSIVPVVGTLDIRPESCPNSVNPRSRGRIPVAIVGTESLDASVIDVDSLLLRRTDGTGGEVAPMARHIGQVANLADVASPFYGELCDCNEFGGDGVDDLVVHFSTTEVVRTLELGSADRDTQIELTLGGSLFDGTPFEASDCVRIVGQPHRATLRDRGRSK